MMYTYASKSRNGSDGVFVDQINNVCEMLKLSPTVSVFTAHLSQVVIMSPQCFSSFKEGSPKLYLLIWNILIECKKLIRLGSIRRFFWVKGHNNMSPSKEVGRLTTLSNTGLEEVCSQDVLSLVVLSDRLVGTSIVKCDYRKGHTVCQDTSPHIPSSLASRS